MPMLTKRLTPETTLRLTSRCSAPIEMVTTLLIFVLHPLSTGANRIWQASVEETVLSAIVCTMADFSARLE